MTKRSTEETLAVERLRQRLMRVRPDVEFDPSGYCRTPTDNLVADVTFADIRAEFSAGAGGELLGKFLAPHSSSALAVNTFAPLRGAGECAELLGTRLPIIAFELKQPTGLRGTPPHLDVLAATDDRVIAIESKCLEPIRTRIPSFEPSYRTLARSRAATKWYAEMVRILDSGDADYRHFDAAQMIKHALGLHANADGRLITLLYLFWEPTDAADWSVFATHRAELAAFDARVAGDEIAFAAMSYPELWARWKASGDPGLARVADHVVARYDLALGTPAD